MEKGMVKNPYPFSGLCTESSNPMDKPETSISYQAGLDPSTS